MLAFAVLAVIFAGATGQNVLMVLTSHSKLGSTGTQTGWYLPEAAHPYFVFKKAGITMTWASPKGGEAPVDEGSVEAYKKDKQSVAFLHKPINTVWKQTVKLEDIDATHYDAVFVVGGYGVMWDLVHNENLQRIAAAIYEDGGIVSGVCHGPATLVNVILSDGSKLVKGKEVACFSNAEEDLLKRRAVVPQTCQDSLKEAGAKYSEGKTFTDNTAVSGRLITGQNPQSAKSAAQQVVVSLKKPKYHVLMVLTSHSKLGSTGTQTGWYLPEAAHPYFVFKQAGIKMTWASPKGGEAPVDEGSVEAYKKDKQSVAFLRKPINNVWKQTVKLEKVDPQDFNAVFVVGGYGVMWDLVKDNNMKAIAATIYEGGGIVSGVCHGPAALVGVKLSDGSKLVKGKEVACFSNAEEDLLKRRAVVPQTCQDSLKEAGAKYSEGKTFTENTAVAGRLITGQNPQSAKSAAKSVVVALKMPRYHVLMVLTSHDKLGSTATQTGWYLPEAAHPYFVFKNAGIKMTWASPKGGEAPVDEGSVEAYKNDKSSVAFLNKPINTVWKHTLKLQDIDPKDYDAVFVVGGYGVMWDLVTDKNLKTIAADIYDDGGIVSGVCHGPAALVNVKLSDGSRLVKGKEVACFSNAEEDLLKRRGLVPETCQDSLKKAGAIYSEGKTFTENTAVSGRVITGQNPQSAKSAAKEVVGALKQKSFSAEKKFGAEIPELVSLSASSKLPFIVGVALLSMGVVGVFGRIVTRHRNTRDHVLLDTEEELLE